MIKSGVIVKIPYGNNFPPIEMHEGTVQLMVMNDPECECIKLKLRYCGKHPGLPVVPEGEPYPIIALEDAQGIVLGVLKKLSAKQQESDAQGGK